MSLDISLTQIQPTTVFSSNMTHNLTPMWVKAGVYNALYMSHGRKAKGYILSLKKGVKDMERYPSKYIKLNSPNGWGTYERALPFLKEVLKAFIENPNAIIDIDK